VSKVLLPGGWPPDERAAGEDPFPGHGAAYAGRNLSCFLVSPVGAVEAAALALEVIDSLQEASVEVAGTDQLVGSMPDIAGADHRLLAQILFSPRGAVSFNRTPLATPFSTIISSTGSTCGPPHHGRWRSATAHGSSRGCCRPGPLAWE